MACLVLSGMPGAALAAPGPAHVPAASPLLSGWPMFHGNVALTGAVGGTPPLRATVQWSTSAPITNPRGNDPPYESSPAVSSGVVYVTMDNVLYALNASTGAALSTGYLPGGPGSGPAVATPLLLSGNVLTVAQDGGPNAQWFQTIPTGTGTNCPLGNNPAPGSSTVVARSVFQPDFAGNVWQTTLGTLLGCPTTPWAAPGGGSSYVATPALGYPRGTPTLFLPDAGTRTLDAYQGVGTTAASVPTGYPATLLGCHLDGSLALLNMTNGTRVSPVGFLGDDCGGGTVSHVLAVNLTSGTLLSALNLPPPLTGGTSGVRSTPALALSGANPHGEEVYFASQDGNLSAASFATNPMGGQWVWGWNFTGKGPFYSSPVVWGGEVLDGDSSGWLYALNGTTGALDWEVNLGSALYSSPAVAGSDVYEVTSAGTTVAIAPAAPPMSLSVPATVNPGTTVPVVVDVQALNASGVPVGGMVGTTVDLSATAGSLLQASSVTNATGDALFDWTAPAGASTPITVQFDATASPPGYAPANAGGTTLVPAGGGGGTTPLTVALSFTSAAVVAGQSQPVQVTVSRLGTPVSGASVTLVLSPSLGSVTPSSAPTGSAGTAQFTYAAPAQVGAATAVLLMATATQGNGSGSAEAPIAVLPATSSVGGLTVQWSTTGSSVAALASENLSVTVANVSTGLPLANAAVAFTVVTPGGGTLSPAQVTTGSAGTASTAFQAGAVGNALPVELLATATLGSASAKATLPVVVDPLPLTLSWVLPSGGITTGAQYSVGIRATSNGIAVGQGLAVTASLVSAGAGHLSAGTVATDASGTAWFTLSVASGATQIDLAASAGGGSGPYGSSNASVNIPVSKTTTGGSSSGSPLDLWLAIALAVVGVVALVAALVIVSRRRPEGGGPGPFGNTPKGATGGEEAEGSSSPPAAGPVPEAAPVSPDASPAESPGDARASGTASPPSAGSAPGGSEPADWKEE